ncbi:MAG: hypothetical protein U5K33_10350 [Halofilum sp. (in: g-proteobacteria)]|nr:hypothetical protein [Halofilum sp. (in: g-proteobacteria)]
MGESFVDYTVGRVGPPILGGSIVGCIIAGELNLLHSGLIAFGLALILFGWARQRPAAT